jgi:hypothetical protein
LWNSGNRSTKAFSQFVIVNRRVIDYCLLVTSSTLNRVEGIPSLIMRKCYAFLLSCGLLLSLLPIALADGATVADVPAAIQQAQAKYLQLPLAFEKRQSGGKEEYVSRGQGYTLALRGGKAFIGVKSPNGSAEAVSLEFAGGRTPKAVPGEELPEMAA